MTPQRTTTGRGRGVWAVVAGFLATAVLSLGTDAILHASGVYPGWGQPMSDGLFAWATGYRVAFTVLGGYIAARFAPGAPMRHALVLGFVGSVAAGLGLIATWNAGLSPRWYPVMLLVTAMPSVWAGGRLGVKSWKGHAGPPEIGKHNDA